MYWILLWNFTTVTRLKDFVITNDRNASKIARYWCGPKYSTVFNQQVIQKSSQVLLDKKFSNKDFSFISVISLYSFTILWCQYYHVYQLLELMSTVEPLCLMCLKSRGVENMRAMSWLQMSTWTKSNLQWVKLFYPDKPFL